jgi:hypothetical protein
MGWRKKGDMCRYVDTCRYGVEEEGGYVSICVDMGWRKRKDMCRYATSSSTRGRARSSVNPMYLLVAILCSCRYTSLVNPIIYIYMSILVLFYISLFQIRAFET